jgi:hypothetical protein
MAKSHRFVGVTFGELAAWHASGETRLLRGRLIDVPADNKATALFVRDGFPVRALLQRLPPLSLDDEEGVLIVKLASGQLSDDDEDSQLVRISMDLVEGVVPLTERARQILIVRLEDYGITPAEAWFEREFRVLSYERRVQSSIRAGNDLVRIFAPGIQPATAHRLEGAAARALEIKDFDGAVAASDDPASVPGTWIAFAFGWTRHKPYDRGTLNHLFDAGVVLRELQAKKGAAISTDAMDAFRSSAKSILKKLGDRARIDEILRCQDFDSAAHEIEAAAPDAFPAGLRALVLYLRWQEQFHNAGSSIDIRRLSDDLARLPIDHEDVLAAVWLLGYYAGCERVAPLVYAADRVRFRWFRGKPLVVPAADASISDAGGAHAASGPGLVGADSLSADGSTEREQPNGGAGSETAADGDGSLSPENPHDLSTVDLDCKADKGAVLDGPVGGDEANMRDTRSAQTDAKETSQQGNLTGFEARADQATGIADNSSKRQRTTLRKKTTDHRRGPRTKTKN